jgi:hypothetical protein
MNSCTCQGWMSKKMKFFSTVVSKQ